MLSLAHEQRAGATVVRVEGEIDAAVAPQLRQYLIDLIAAGNTRLIIDLSRVPFLDSTALGTFIGARKRLLPRRGTVELAAIQPQVRAVFSITGLDRSFTIHTYVTDAWPAGAGD